MLIFAIREQKELKVAWQRDNHTESSGGNVAEDVRQCHQTRQNLHYWLCCTTKFYHVPLKVPRTQTQVRFSNFSKNQICVIFWNMGFNFHSTWQPYRHQQGYADV